MLNGNCWEGPTHSCHLFECTSRHSQERGELKRSMVQNCTCAFVVKGVCSGSHIAAGQARHGLAPEAVSQ